MSFLTRARNFYADPEYFGLLFKIALPIATQNLLMSSLNMVSSVMIGQLGETTVAANGLSGQIFFLLNLVLFGMMSGAGILTAQLWGKRDAESVRRVLGFAVKLGLVGAAVFWFVAVFTPEPVLRLYTGESADAPQLIALAGDYLRVFGWSFPFFTVTFAYAIVLRTTGNVRVPLVVSVTSLAINTALAYALIFGLFGFPKMGYVGAAWAGLVARIFECFFLLVLIYRDSDSPAAASLKHLLDFDPQFAARVLRPILPVLMNEILWSLGITTYSIIYTRMGKESLAAINIVGPIDQLAFVAFLGIGNATAILVGNKIGQKQPGEAFRYAGRSLSIQIGLAAMLGLVVYLGGDVFFQLYNVSAAVVENARHILAVMAAGMWVRASNHVLIVGILRSGGDTRFSLILDGLVIWLVGVPLAALGAFYWHLPVQWVYALAMTEEVTKFAFGLARYFSRKWINDLTGLVEGQ